MRLRYVAGAGLVMGAFIVIALVTYYANRELYLTVDQLLGDRTLYAVGDTTGLATASVAGPDGSSSSARRQRRLQVRGEVDDRTVQRPSEGLEMRFTLMGDVGRLPVVYRGMVPDTFEQAEVVTVAGHVGGDGVFEADDLLVQCPSKYEAATPGASRVPAASPP